MARTVAHVGPNGLSPEQRQFILASDVSHKSPEEVERLTKAFNHQFRGAARIDPRDLRTVLRREQRRRGGGRTWRFSPNQERILRARC